MHQCLPKALFLLWGATLFGCGPFTISPHDNVKCQNGIADPPTAQLLSVSFSTGTMLQAVEPTVLRSEVDPCSEIVAQVLIGASAVVLADDAKNGHSRVTYRGQKGWTQATHWNPVDGLYLRGHRLGSLPERWIRWIAQATTPALRGEQDQRIANAALVAWWALKEGILDLPNPFAFSNCLSNSNDVRLEPLEWCEAGRAWQVGLAGIQVPTFSTDQVEDAADELFPDASLNSLLRRAALAAGFNEGTEVHTGIVNSTGDLKKSWLLRHHAIGFSLQAPVVNSQCIEQHQRWCFGSDWSSSERFAPSKEAALEVISELVSVFSALTPQAL